MKNLLILFMLLSIELFAQAQAKVHARTQTVEASFGIKGGLVLANLTPAEGDKYRPSYQLGILGQFKLTGKHYLQTELLFSNEGAGDLKYGTALYNLLIPILYKTDLNHWLSLEIGPQVSVNVYNNLWYIDNTFWFNGDLGLSAYVSETNYFTFRYSKGLIPVITGANYFSSVFSLTLVNVF